MFFVIRNLPIKFQVDPPINVRDMLRKKNVSVTDQQTDQHTDQQTNIVIEMHPRLTAVHLTITFYYGLLQCRFRAKSRINVVRAVAHWRVLFHLFNLFNWHISIVKRPLQNVPQEIMFRKSGLMSLMTNTSYRVTRETF